MATSKDPKSSFPYPYRKGRHEVTHADARRMRKRAITALGTQEGFGRAAGYHREIFDKILAQPACVGVRCYPGLDDKGEFTFAPLPAGEYMIRVAHQGHLELRMRIEAKPDQDKPLDIRLRTNIGVQRCVASRYHTPDCP